LLILEGQTGPISKLAFAPNGRILAATGGCTGTISLWSLHGHGVESLQDVGQFVKALVFAPGGGALAALDECRVHCWDPGQWDERFQHTLPKLGPGGCLRFSPDGRALQVATAVYERDGAQVILYEWDASSGEEIRTVSGRISGTPLPVAFLPGRVPLVALTHGLGKMTLWGPSAVKEELSFPPNTVKGYQLSFAPDGQTFSTHSGSGVRVWSLNPFRSRSAFKEKRYVNDVAWSPGGRTVATGGNAGTVSLWDAATGRRRATLDPQVGRVHALAFSPSGMTAAAGGDTGRIAVWDVDDV
jgi:WD40 repeat protein